MTACNNKIDVYVGVNNDRVIQFPCGSTDEYGTARQCDECAQYGRVHYPQGWRNVPGDICKHGTYVGGPSGPDHICGHCEDES
jgi:hypothetical protein